MPIGVYHLTLSKISQEGTHSASRLHAQKAERFALLYILQSRSRQE